MTKQKIFIKRIELIDFESHKHTVLDGLSDGFNIITADSDVGKTSVLRALMLCAYNQFNPESVRLGAQYCDVTVTSNLGYVNVKRGTGMNLWTVKRNDVPDPMVFDKVGRNEVKEACAVLGMKMIQLGDIFIPVNIMNQLEGHFLINSVGDEKTSGSGRAQIIDEICGLNGAEELIKNISLDQYRITRKITESEERIKDLQSRLHSEHDIKRDEEILATLNRLEENIQVCKNNKEYLDEMVSSHRELIEQKGAIEKKISSLPDSSRAIELEKESAACLARLSVLRGIMQEYKSVVEKLERNSKEKAKLPDVIDFKDDWKSWVRKLDLYKGLVSEYNVTTQKLKEIKTKLGNIKDCDISELLISAQNANEKLSACRDFLRTHNKLSADLNRVRVELKKKEEDMDAVEKQISDLYKTIDVCPITKLPITDKCSLIDARSII